MAKKAVKSKKTIKVVKNKNSKVTKTSSNINLNLKSKSKLKGNKNKKNVKQVVVTKTKNKVSKGKNSKVSKNVASVPIQKPLRATKAENKKLTKKVTKIEEPVTLTKKVSKKDNNVVSTEPSVSIPAPVKEEKTTIITKDDDGNEIIDMTKLKNSAPVVGSNDVLLKCVKQGSKLRVRIISPGYYNDANCQFPKDIRKEGRVFKVNVKEVVLAEGSAGRYFYRIKNGITILDGVIDENITKVKIFEDRTENDCAVCLCSPKSTVIVPCGHFYTCKDCSSKLDKCPICRGSILKLIDKTNMD